MAAARAKGGAKGTPKKPATRSSPAKKTKADDGVTSGKVTKKTKTKKASPAKAQGTKKQATTSPSPAKTRFTTSPSPTRATSPKKQFTTSPSPAKTERRGRPRKGTQTDVADTRAASRASSRARSRTPDSGEDDYDPHEEEWTDSPKKQSPSKRNTRQGSVGGVHRSIEKPTEPARGKSPSRARSKSPTKPRTRGRPRKPSIEIDAMDIDVPELPDSPVRTRSKSPAKARSKSPAKPSGRGRPRKPTVEIDTMDIDIPELPASPVRTRSKSPAKAPAPSQTSRQRSQSPVKSRANVNIPEAAPERSNRTRSPSKGQTSAKKDEDIIPLAKGKPSAPGRGVVHSITNPQFIANVDVKRKNPFFETMPAPEVWHRMMPPFLPFGETPLMEEAMSRQISQDLADGMEKTQPSGGLLSSLFGSFGKKTQTGKSSHMSIRKSPWTLPEVPDTNVAVVKEILQRMTGVATPGSGTKRKGSVQLAGGSVKRARRKLGDQDVVMSGAL